MNPYLEQEDAWEDFHDSLIVAIREQLESVVGPAYFVKIEARLYVHEIEQADRHYLGRGDVSVHELRRDVATGTGSTAVLEAPLVLLLPDFDIERQTFLEIRDRASRRLVTVIELLSPSNKTVGDDRDQYLSKRREILGTLTHFVEIDLRRGGVRAAEDLPTSDYCVLVSRYLHRPHFGVWPIDLRDPLPSMSIPLADPDEVAPLDLQAALHRAYDAANYGKYIYQGSPQPPLSEIDEGWARQFVPGAAA